MPKSAPESPVSCPCCGLWHCEVTLLLCNAPCQVPTLHALTVLPFFPEQRQGYLAKVIQQGETHTQHGA